MIFLLIPLHQQINESNKDGKQNVISRYIYHRYCPEKLYERTSLFGHGMVEIGKLLGVPTDAESLSRYADFILKERFQLMKPLTFNRFIAIVRKWEYKQYQKFNQK